MKFFDYKFLILLGLSLVVYFIYREVEYLNTKVYKLEKDIKLLSDNTTNSTTSKAQLPLPLPLPSIKSQQPVIPLPQIKPLQSVSPLQTVPQLLPLPLLQPIHHLQELHQLLQLPELHSQNNVYSVSPKIINIDLSPSNSKCENKKNKLIISENSDSDTSIHLAIYSNDNDQYEDAENSLLESIESHKFDYNEQASTLNIESSDDEVISSKSNKSPKSPKSNKSLKLSKSAELDKLTNLDGLHKIPELSESTELSDLPKSTKSTKSIKASSYDKKVLEEKKLPEIKKIAESLKISLSKKNNGTIKIKSKNDLIIDIMNLQLKSN